MKLSLINDLNESTQYRSRAAFTRVSARQVADHAFMDMIALWILYNEFEYAPQAIAYAAKTSQLKSFNRYLQSETDLYLNLHVIAQKRSDLLSTEADQVALDRFFVNDRHVLRYLSELSRNTIREGQVRVTLQRLEQGLRIENSNYRSIRRLAQSWPTLDTSRKRAVVSRMLMFYRANARRSEMFTLLQSLAATKNFSDPNAKNTELHPAAKAAAAAAAGYIGYKAGWRLGKSLM